jgi:CubicO group peptidase (beta-lactamase class C family)
VPDLAGEWEVRWDRTFTGWWPPVFEGRMTLTREGDGWKGELVFKQSTWRPTLMKLEQRGDQLELIWGDGGPATMHLTGWVREGRLIGEMRSGDKVGPSAFSGRRSTLAPLEPRTVDGSLPRRALAPSPELAHLLDQARTEHSTAIVVLEKGNVAVEAYSKGYSGDPVFAMSASKSITSLAVGMLIADGKLSLDTTMGTLFPAWKKLGDKGKITVRQLLAHTSGLDPTRADFQNETIEASATRAKLVFAPGKRFQYNNAAVDFLAVVFARAAGTGLDKYLAERLFSKLGAVGVDWMRDNAAVPRAAGELMLRPVDLAKIGQLVLAGGMWEGQQLVPRAWLEESMKASQPYDETCGLLWWREGEFDSVITAETLEGWASAGAEKATIASARKLVGKRFPDEPTLFRGLTEAVGDAPVKALQAVLAKGNHVPWSGHVARSLPYGFSARGFLGQFLVVYPAAGVVGVRMREGTAADYQEGAGGSNGYPGFAKDLASVFHVK